MVDEAEVFPWWVVRRSLCGFWILVETLLSAFRVSWLCSRVNFNSDILLMLQFKEKGRTDLG